MPSANTITDQARKPRFFAGFERVVEMGKKALGPCCGFASGRRRWGHSSAAVGCTLPARQSLRLALATEVKLFSQLHAFFTPCDLLTGEVQGEFYSLLWQLARADSFEPHGEDAATDNARYAADSFQPA